MTAGFAFAIDALAAGFLAAGFLEAEVLAADVLGRDTLVGDALSGDALATGAMAGLVSALAPFLSRVTETADGIALSGAGWSRSARAGAVFTLS